MQAGGQRFESVILHVPIREKFFDMVERKKRERA